MGYANFELKRKKGNMLYIQILKEREMKSNQGQVHDVTGQDCIEMLRILYTIDSYHCSFGLLWFGSK